jgi:hypothetical protein
MKKILRKYPETILIALAIIFLGIVFSSFSWGIGNVVEQVNRGVNAKAGDAGSVTFDLKGARALDLRGLVKPAP